MTRGVLCLAAFAAACASGSGGTTQAPAPASPNPYPPPASPATPAGDRPAAPPPAGGVVRYGPNAVRYVVRRESHIQQGVGEQARTQDLGTRTFLMVAISGPADSVGYPATFVVDSIVADSGTPAQIRENLDRAKRLVLSGRIAPGGEFRHAVPSDSAAAQSLTQLLSGFRDFLPRIPARGVQGGIAWTDTLERRQKSAGLEVTIHAVVHGRATAWEDSAGTRGLRIEGASTYTIAGSGQNAGQPVEIAGQGAGTGVSFLAADGRFLSAEARDSANLTYRFLNEGVALPVTQVTRTIVSAVP